jgi:hypothetical protein
MNRPLDGGDGHQKNPSEKDVPSLLQGHRH